MDIVSEVLLKAAKKVEGFKSIHVEKHLELDYDLGTLLAIDNNDLDLKQLRSNCNIYLKNLARDNTQLLLNKIWELPTERVEEAIVAKLPPPTYVLPRENAIPKPKALTKWQKFAQEKGITKKIKSKLTWDEILQKWIPNYGYKKAAAEKQKDWIVAVPNNSDPLEDQFAKKSGVKQEKVAKNEFQRLRNLAKSKSIKVPRAGLVSTEKLSSEQFGAALTLAKASTASLGKFQAQLPKEKRAKKIGALLPSEKKRKLLYLQPKQEKKSNLSILDNILNKKPKLDMEKAVNKELYREQQERSEEKKTQKPRKGAGKKRGSGGPGKKGKGAGKRATSKPGGGRAFKPGGGKASKGSGKASKPGGGKGSRVKPGSVVGRKRR